MNATNPAAGPLTLAPTEAGAPAANDPLAALRPLHEPLAVSWWPPAPGWWLLGGLALLLTGYVIYRLVGRYRARAYRRQALSELDALLANTSLDDTGFAAAINTLLRRAARCIDADSARLTGEDWLAFLDQRLSAPVFAGATGQGMLAGAYSRGVSVDRQALGGACRHWLRHHR